MRPSNNMAASLWPLLAPLLLSFAPCSWAIVCYHCDSIALPECAMTLGEVGLLPYVECAKELTCTMSIVDSITYRGCGGNTPTVGASYTKSCDANLCNAGVYPPGRLKCHHCAGQSCVSQPAGKPRPCHYHHEQDQCYTEVQNSTDVYRGCVSDSNHTITAPAQYCDINGCNDATAAGTLSCVRCDSEQGRGCKMDLFEVYSGKCNITLFEQCQVDVLLTKTESCFTYRRMSRVVRGCLAELPPDLQDDAEHLVACNTGNNCNIGCLEQQRCLSCDSATDELCRSNATQLRSGICASAEASSCYACEYNDWNVRRGCGTPPTSADITRCYECDADGGCNALPFTRCYQCSSAGEAAASCATWERPVGVSIEECQAPAAPCIMASFVNGTTLRGCQTTNFNCNSSDVLNCRSCEGSFCNKDAFPAQRLFCHQCAGGASCATISKDPMPCAMAANEPADAALACLEYYDTKSQQVIRGCRTDAQLYYNCMLANGHSEACHLCRSNGCNARPLHELRKRNDLESIMFTKSAATKIICWFNIIYLIISLN